MPKPLRTVLFVDDVKEDRVLIRRALRQDPNVDYQVLEAENGAQALSYLHELQPDCLLLDYKLPDTDGLALLKTIVDQAAPHIYPVVMLTSTHRTALVVETMQQGAHDFLPKATFTAEHLHQAIQNATEKVALLRQLDEQREWFRLALASISDGVITTNIEGCITFMNPIAERLTHWTAHEAQGQPLAQVFTVLDETTGQPAVDPVTQVLRTHQIVSQTNYTLLAGRSGLKLFIDYNAALIQDRLGAATGVVITFRDVSARKEAEEKIRRSEQRLKLALDAARMVAWEWNPHTNQIITTANFHALYGLPALAGVEEGMALVHPDDVTQHNAKVNQVASQGGMYHSEFRIRRPDNHQQVWLEEWGYGLLDEAGQVTKLVGVVRDITDRKAAEDALRASEEFNRTVLESSPDCINVLDAEGCVLMINKPGLVLLEIEDDIPLYGQPWTQLWPAACAQQIQAALSTGRQGETAHFQAFCPTTRGTPKWWDMIVAPVRNATGELTRFIVAARDITESKRAEELLYERTALLQAVIESTPTPIWAKDHAGRTTLGNQATFALLAGGVQTKVLGHNALEIFPESEQARQVMEGDLRVIRTGIAEVSDQTFKASDQLRFFQTTKAPLRNSAGEVVGLVGVSIDITERKRAEANQQLLLDLDAHTRLLTEADAILAKTVERLGQYLGGLSCTFVEINVDQDQAVVCAHWRRHDALPTLIDAYKISEVLNEEIALMLVSGQSVVITDMAHDPHTMARAAMYKAQFSVESMVVVPFHLKGALLSTLTITNEQPRTWRTDEVTLLENVIARIWPLVLKVRAEQALRHQEAFVRQIADNIPGLVGYLSADERYHFVNATFETWFQCPRHQLIGSTPRELLGAESYAKFTPYRQQALAGKTVTYENRLAYSDGITRAIWGRYQPDIAADGSVLGFYIFVMDISERKQSEDDARFLADVAEMIRLTDNVDALMEVVTQSVGNYLQVGRCRFIEVDWANDRAIIHRDYCRDVPSVAGEFQLSNYQPNTLGEMATGRTLVNHDAKHDARTAALYDAVYAPTEERAYIGVPLMRNGQWQGVFSVTTPNARQWQLREIQLLETIAERAWLAVEKLRLDAALRASEEQLRQITANLPGLISVVNAREEYEFVNRNYQRWLGLEPTQMLGRKIELALHDKGAYQMLQPHLQRALAGETVTFENHLMTTQGNALDVMVTHVPRRDAAGQVTGCYILALDITARKQAEEQLRVSEERFRTLANAMPQLVWTADAQGNVDYYNVRIHDYASAVQLADGSFDWSRLVHPDDLASTFTAWQTATKRGVPYSFEHRLCMADHSWRWHLSLALPMAFADNQVKWYGTATDIHDRKQLEEALRASEAQLNAILYNIPAAVYMLTTDHRYLMVNRVYEQENQITSAEIYGQSVYDRWPAAAAETLVATERQVLATKAPIVVEETVQREGEARTYATVKAPLLDADGEPAAIIGISLDITARLRAEAALVEREAFLRSITDAVPNLIGYIDQHRCYRFVNATYAQWFARPREQIEGSTMQDLLGEHLNTWRHHWQSALAGDTVHFEETFTYPDGVTRTVMGTYIPHRNEKGEVLGFYLYINDITARKIAEERVRDSEERFRAVANLVPDLLWSNDPTGVTEWHNQRWLEYNGQMFEKAAPDGWLATVHPDDRALALHNFQRAIAQGEPLREEQRIGSATGEYRWFLVQANPFKDATGKILRWFGAATDIHEQRMARETLEQRVQERTQELETLSVIRQQLLARIITAQEDERRRIAHELHDTLGQFLSALNLRLSLLQQSVQPQDGTASPVVAELGQLWHLVNEIDSELRRLTMELRPPILDDLGLAEAIRHYAKAWSQTTAIPVDVYSTGFASAHLPHTADLSIYRIVQEALTNILKHAQATAVSVILEQRSKALQVIIEDNGIGFDPNAVGSQQAGRRALGLIGMKERAALVGGRVDVETAPGAGTTIYVHIPLITNKGEENE